jgi:hypothetical protein
MTLQEFEREWRTALDASYDFSSASSSSRASRNDDERKDGAADPFDCSSLAIPPTHTLIDNKVLEFIEEWRKLDERKILSSEDLTQIEGEDENDNNNNDDDDTARPHKKARTEKLPKWYVDRTRLPEQFDYESKSSDPPLDDGRGDRVVSLEDPTQTLSYHTELWKLFQNVPRATQIETDATAHCNLPHLQALQQEMAKSGNIRPIDAFALSRLRYHDRHDAVPTAALLENTMNGNQKQPQNMATKSWVASIQLECWRRQPKRGSSPE